MNIEYRVKYYLGNLYEMFKNNQKIDYHVYLNEKEEITYNRIQLINNNMLFYDNYNYQIRHYINDLRKCFSESKIVNFNVFIALGDIDIKMKQFCFTKRNNIAFFKISYETKQNENYENRTKVFSPLYPA